MLLRFEAPTAANGVFLPVPLWVRLPLVALLIVWGARTDRRWVLPIGMTFSLPTVWLNTPTILVAILPLHPAGRRYAGRRAGCARRRARRPLRSSGCAAGSGGRARAAPRDRGDGRRARLAPVERATA